MKIGGKRAKPVVETQMVSLADIAFLIIFFFLLTSSFMKDRKAVNLPVFPEINKTNSAISVAVDETKTIFLDGDPVPDKDVLESRLKGLLSGKTKPEDCEVRFRCEKTLAYKDYHPIYEAISNAGGVIAIMHDLTPNAPVAAKK